MQVKCLKAFPFEDKDGSTVVVQPKGSKRAADIFDSDARGISAAALKDLIKDGFLEAYKEPSDSGDDAEEAEQSVGEAGVS